jgi:LacI family transcriptional regulator
MRSMLRRRVTLRDVADRAGVHPSTASRAINAHTRSLVDDQTVVRVLEAATDLGYQPDSLARALKTNRTHTVGMLLPDLTNPLFPPIVRGVEDGLGGADYTVILANTDNDPDKERKVLGALLARRVDGLILATTLRDPSTRIVDLLDEGVPTILVNRTVDDPPVPSVLGDDRAGIGLAVDHLVELGHTRIAHVAGPQQTSTGLLRHDSFVASMERAGLPADRDRIVVAEWFREEQGAQACRTLLDRCPDTTAIVAGNDLIAIGCYDVAQERELEIGVDLSVVGYNDMLFADKLCPPLTTIHVPHYRLGLRAAQLILDLINDGDVAPELVLLEPATLVRRASTGPPT